MVFATMGDELRRARERENTMHAFLRANAIRPARGSDDSQYPISLFILGPSRSGKTTMERIVGTIEGVKRGYENPSVDVAVRRAVQSAGLLTSSYFELLPAKLHSLCGDIYLGELARRAGSAKVFTNTHPARISDAGLMAATYPNVRFIGVRRNLEDTILRMFQFKYNE